MRFRTQLIDYSHGPHEKKGKMIWTEPPGNYENMLSFRGVMETFVNSEQMAYII